MFHLADEIIHIVRPADWSAEHCPARSGISNTPSDARRSVTRGKKWCRFAPS